MGTRGRWWTIFGIREGRRAGAWLKPKPKQKAVESIQIQRLIIQFFWRRDGDSNPG